MECGGKRQRHAALGCAGGARRVFAAARPCAARPRPVAPLPRRAAWPQRGFTLPKRCRRSSLALPPHSKIPSPSLPQSFRVRPEHGRITGRDRSVFWAHRSAPCDDARARGDDGRARGEHRSALLDHRRVRLGRHGHTRGRSQGARQSSQGTARSSGRTLGSLQRTRGWPTGARTPSPGARGTSTGAIFPPQDAARTRKCARKAVKCTVFDRNRTSQPIRPVAPCRSSPRLCVSAFHPFPVSGLRFPQSNNP